MTESFSPEEIENVPTQEIARWAARIKRVNYALSQNESICVGSDTATSDDSAVVDQFAKKVADANRMGFNSEDWLGDPSYEDSILYELKPTVELRSVVQLKLMQSPERGVQDEAIKTYWAAGRMVLHDGLERIGVITDDETNPGEFSVPAAAMANFCLQRDL